MEGTTENNKTTQVSKFEREKNRMEINNTLILAIATLAITWCSYQSNLWNGIQTFRLADSNKFSRLANQKIIELGQNREVDVAIIAGFVDAVIEKKEDRVKYILRGIRPELSKIMAAWLQLHPFENPSAPFHPMAMPEYKQLVEKSLVEAEKLSKKAGDYRDAAQKANTNSDNYTLLTVIFSMVMFLGAITTKITQVRLSFTLIVVAGLICIGVLILLFFFMPLATE